MQLEDFYNDVLPYVPNVDYPLLDNVISRVVDQFLQETGLLEVKSKPIDVVSGTAKYTIKLADSGLKPVKCRHAWYNSTKLTHINRDSLDIYFNTENTTNSTPTLFYQEDPLTVTLFPTPDKSLTGGLVCQVQATTIHPLATIPSVLDSYREVLVNGIIGNLLVSNNPAFANPSLGARFMNAYEAGLANARSAAYRDMSGNLTARARRWL